VGIRQLSLLRVTGRPHPRPRPVLSGVCRSSAARPLGQMKEISPTSTFSRASAVVFHKISFIWVRYGGIGRTGGMDAGAGQGESRYYVCPAAQVVGDGP
ncbi:hypothetical protein, partial [Salinibacterium sp.]|uniref:hypothetical protein n=1 Tax=Salinibacterium sp. TaxID=1915057 RepID=UPI00286D292F